MRIGSSLAVSFVTTLVLGGCAYDDLSDGDLSTTTGESAVENGHNLNGHNLNGHNLNGHNLNGTSELGNVIAWVSYKDASLGGSDLKNVKLDGSQLVARRHHIPVGGTGMVGATFEAQSDTGEDLSLRVAAVFPPGVNQDPTTWRYLVEYQETDGGWEPICVNDTNVVPAIPVDGYWNLDSGSPGDGGKVNAGAKFLFACEQVGAIGKCVEAGYRPWQKVGHTKLDRHHEACVRLLRADFCGDSVSHTTDGALVNIYDALGVQVDTETWFPEAEWDRHGARCISPDAPTPGLADAACRDALLDDDCALSFHHRTLLVSERP